MKRINLICTVAVLLLSPTVRAQRKIRVVDGTSGQPLPFATIVNITHPAVQFADEQGALDLPWDDADSIRITHVGYQDRVMQVRNAGGTISLARKASVLKTVVVRSCASPVSHHYSNFDSVSTASGFGGVWWADGIATAKVAVPVFLTTSSARLSRIEFALGRALGAPKRFPKSPLRFTFYSIDPATQLPGEALSDQSVIYYPKKNGKQIVFVDSLRLSIPATGLYVGIEYLVDPKECYPVHFRDSTLGTDSVIMRYGVLLEGLRTRGCPLATYNYRSGAWLGAGGRKETDPNVPSYTIRFGVVYTTCE
ncbi:peptidase associated/transthyretin-like domain-containing protein [Flaviaesturariibacter terrae]